MIPLLPPTSHPVLRDPTLPFKTTKRTKSKAAVHHDGTRGTKVYHNLNMSANHVRSVGGGRQQQQQQNGVRSCIVGKKNKYDKKGNLRMMKFTQAHIDNSDNPHQEDKRQTQRAAANVKQPKKQKTQTSFTTKLELDDHHMHLEAGQGRNDNPDEEKHHEDNDEMGDTAATHEGEDHSDVEIDYDQQLYDYRSASHSPMHHHHQHTSPPPPQADEEEAVLEGTIITTTSPLPLCPPRHGGRKYLYEYEGLDIERGLVRLPRWMESHERKNALETLLSERFGKRYPVSWRKRTQVPLYNHKHYADAF